MGVVMLPATFFAPVVEEARQDDGGDDEMSVLLRQLESWVRVSVANVDDEQIVEVARRLNVFAQGKGIV